MLLSYLRPAMLVPVLQSEPGYVSHGAHAGDVAAGPTRCATSEGNGKDSLSRGL